MIHDITPTDPVVRGYRRNHQYLFHLLTAALPPPRDDRPETLAERDEAAVIEVASLCPANAAEVAMAVQIVAANLQAVDCLRMAKEPGIERGLALKCMAQSASMMRQAHSGARTLNRLQAVRKARDANTAAADEAAWTEYHVAQSMRAEPQPPPAFRPPEDDRPTPFATVPTNEGADADLRQHDEGGRVGGRASEGVDADLRQHDEGGRVGGRADEGVDADLRQHDEGGRVGGRANAGVDAGLRPRVAEGRAGGSRPTSPPVASTPSTAPLDALYRHADDDRHPRLAVVSTAEAIGIAPHQPHQPHQAIWPGLRTPVPSADAPPPPAAAKPRKAPKERDPDPGMTAAEWAAAVETYVIIYPQRAALIRRHGGVPDNATFGPPDEMMVRAIVTGDTPALRALDDEMKTETEDQKKSS